MGLFEEYIAPGADFSALGFSRCDPEPGYFCDPVGARVIGAVGVDVYVREREEINVQL